MVPIAVLTAVVRQPVVEILFGSGQIRPADLDLIAVDAAAFLDRADRARPDRGPGPGVLRPPGHGHAGRSPRSAAVAINCTPGGRPRRAARPARASRSRSRSRPGSRRSSCSRSCTAGCRTSSCAGSARVGVEAVVGSVAGRGRGVAWPASWLTDALGVRPGAARPRRRGHPRQPRLRRWSTRRSRSPCGSPNCRLSSGSWPTCSAARPGRDGRRPHGVGRVRRGE